MYIIVSGVGDQYGKVFVEATCRPRRRQRDWHSAVLHDQLADFANSFYGRLSSSSWCTKCCGRALLPTDCIAICQPIVHSNAAAAATTTTNVVVAITAQSVWRFGGFVWAVSQLSPAARVLGYQHPKVPWCRAGCDYLPSKCRDSAFLCVLCKCKQLVPKINLGHKSNPCASIGRCFLELDQEYFVFFFIFFMV